MLKRSIVLTLVCLIVISAALPCFTYANDETQTESNTETVYDGQKLIEYLGIISSDTDSNDDRVTREMFAVYVARMLKLDVQNTKQVRYFSDVEYDAFSVNAINSLVENNIISVPDNHIFRPGDYITNAEAIKMLVCAMGYDNLAEADGGFPYGYFNVANKLELCKNADFESGLTVAEAGEIIYKALLTNMYSFDTIKNDRLSFSQSDDTLLKVYWKIEEKEGTVQAVYGGSILSDAVLNKNEAFVEYTKYSVAPEVDMSEYLGNYVKFFYRTDRVGIANEIIHIEKQGSLPDLVINAADYESYDDKKIGYYGSTDKVMYKKLKNPIVVYNGEILGENVSSVMNSIDKGKITLKDSDDDGIFDVLLVEDYRIFVISAFNKETNSMFDKIGFLSSVCFDDFDCVTVLNTIGEELNYKDLAVGQVLSVSASKNKRFIKIILESNTVQGTLDALIRDNNLLKISVSGAEYEVDNMFVNYLEERVKVGQEYTFTIDSFGKVSYLILGDDDWKYGYIIDIDNEYISHLTKIKLVTATGEVKTFDCAKNVVIDGKKRTGEDIRNNLVLSDGTFYQVIRYITGDELIKRIDTDKIVEDDVKTSMQDIFSGNNRVRRWCGDKRLGNKALLNSATVVFCRPDADDDIEDSNVYVMKYNQLVSDKIYISDAYKDGTLESYAGAVVVYYDLVSGIDAVERPFMVERIYRAVYNDELVTAIEGFEAGSKKTVYDDEEMDFSNVSKGDILIFAYDRDGTLKRKNLTLGYDLVYDCSTKTAPFSNGTHWFNTAVLVDSEADPTFGFLVYNKGSADSNYYRDENLQLSYGTVLDKNDSVIGLNGTGGDIPADVIDTTGVTVIVYDEAADKLYAGSVDDIADKESAGENASRVFLELKGPKLRTIMVYNYK